jgi:predicted small secreted protein
MKKARFTGTGSDVLTLTVSFLRPSSAIRAANLVAIACAIALAGCNTMAGMGRDADASAKARADWRAARDRHERDYDNARTGCNSGTDAQRESCRERARAAYIARMNQSREAYRRSGVSAQSEEDRREEAYEMAREKCEAFHGVEEDRCIDDVRARYRR